MDTLLIVGDAKERRNDLEAFWKLGSAHDVCCLNRAGFFHPGPFRFWWSVHPEILRGWAGGLRRLEGLRSCFACPGVQTWPLPDVGGGSALTAVRAALAHWGYRRIVLAGVPLAGPYRHNFERSFRRALPEVGAFVRSMSGFTRELFGSPGAVWLL